MTLTAGARLGPYEVLSPLGAGGMGEVYRARDTKLNRDVAIKILPEAVSTDPERLARFHREAQVLASLNHPNIAAIYGFEDSNVTHALVMELVEGPTLADRIAEGPIPVNEALPIARQIAEALEAAHEQGIIHRDLKPANIKVRDDGTVKVLDFGLAKALDPAPGSGLQVPRGLTQSPTLTSPLGTMAGVILGTAAYMSPEQARGKTADKRSDIWAFGCVLFEMLTGQQAFPPGETVSDAVAAILTREPEWSALPSETSLTVRKLLKRCLQKDLKQRLQDIGDARLEIVDALAGPAPNAAPEQHVRRTGERFAWSCAGLLGVAAITAAVIALRQSPAPLNTAFRFTVAAPQGTTFQYVAGTSTRSAPNFVISPDGRQLVFVASTQGRSNLWLRSFDSLEARPIPGTEHAVYPFWSPDGKFIGFFADAKLKKVRLAGGSPIPIVDARVTGGASWGRDDVIVYSTAAGALFRIPATGGPSTPATRLTDGQTSHRWPHFLPDGRHFLYLAGGPPGSRLGIEVASLDSNAVSSVVAAESSMAYAGGYLFFLRDGNLMAQPFDPTSQRISGEPTILADRIGFEPAAGARYASFDVSPNGTLVYAQGGAGATLSRLTWFDRTGRSMGSVGDVGIYSNLALEPGEKRIAVSLTTGSPANRDIWIIDIEGSPRRFTFDRAVDAIPTWSPDGKRIGFQSQNDPGLRVQNTDGSGATQVLLKLPGIGGAMDWSRNGQFIIFWNNSETTGGDLWIVPTTGDAKPFPFYQTPSNEDHGAFSPDTRWIAYTSDESGQEQVYVQPFPATGEKHQVTQAGGTQPLWRSNGKEMFYMTADGIVMAVETDLSAGFRAGKPQPLFKSGAFVGGSRRQYAVTSDGQRFLVNVPQPVSSDSTITIVTNWNASLQK